MPTGCVFLSGDNTGLGKKIKSAEFGIILLIKEAVYAPPHQ